jgi:hypothetical protein
MTSVPCTTLSPSILPDAEDAGREHQRHEHEDVGQAQGHGRMLTGCTPGARGSRGLNDPANRA